MNIKLIRHATLLLTIKNKTLLIDPMLSARGALDAVTEVPNKSNNPLVDLPVPIDYILNCDAVLITHTHRDHFDEAAINTIPKDKLIFCQPQDEEKLDKLGFTNVVAIKRHYNWGEIVLTRTPAKHGHGMLALTLSPVSGFIISAIGETTTYITGDTVWYSKTKKTIDRYNPKIVICNCGEARFSHGKPITMDTKDIHDMCRYLPSLKIVAVHMDAWNHCRLTRNDLKKFVIENNLTAQIIIPADGEELML